MASCVFVQLGQCGTQLGHHLINTLYQDATDSPTGFSSTQNQIYKHGALDTYFNELPSGHHETRAVTIDMEPKVINWALESAKKGGNWTYPKNMQLCRKSGSGNNWSFGFEVHGPKCQDEVLDMLQKESEKCDRLSGFVLMMSLAGGTGSGVGSYVAQLLHDNFPHSVLLNPIVMPYMTGEVAVQNYNAILTLSSVLSHVNASILLHNDHLHNICTKLLSIHKVSIDDLNSVAAHQLASILQPSLSSSKGSRDILYNIVQSTSSHSQYKLLNLKHVPHMPEQSIAFSTFNWQGLLKRLRQMHLTDFFVDEGMDWQVKINSNRGVFRKPTKSLGNILFLRGTGATYLGVDEFLEFRDARLYTPWIPSNERCHIWSCERSFRKCEKSVSLLSNNSMCVSELEGVVKKAWEMFGAKAYMHQYTKYGLAEEDFLNSFIKVENVINSYLNI